MKNAKQYLESFLRLNSYGFVGRFSSPEAKEFQKDKKENLKFKHDDILTWCVRKALECLLVEEKTCGLCLLRRVGDSWCTKFGKKTTIDRRACQEWVAKDEN